MPFIVSFLFGLTSFSLLSNTVLALPGIYGTASSSTRSSNPNDVHYLKVPLTSLEMEDQDASLLSITTVVTQRPPQSWTPLPDPTCYLVHQLDSSGNSPLRLRNTDPFQPVATGSIPAQISPRTDHPIPRLNIAQSGRPLQTNKFYSNLFLGRQNQGVFSHPYSLAWSKGGGPISSWGMAVTQLDYRQKNFGTPSQALPGNPAQYVINPVGIQNLVLSASEFGASTTLQTDHLETFSVNAVLYHNRSSTITFPVTQGMGFVTAIYNNLTPLIQSGFSITSMIRRTSPDAGIFKYRLSTNDGNIWFIYAIPTNSQDPRLTLNSTGSITGCCSFSGVVQIAKNPNGPGGGKLYDASAGVYATSATLTGSVSGSVGSYTLTWAKSGAISKKLLTWALPHHIKSFSNETSSGVQGISLTTTTKGNATAIVANAWTLIETNLPSSLGFAPWDPATHLSRTSFSQAAMLAITAAASAEVSENMGTQSNLNSMYYSGKALAKFASVLYVAKDVLKNDTLAAEGLGKLETAFALFSSNQQQFPLVHDNAWGGIVSSASYINGNLGSDFGNTAYNDHHFHWGYFIYAAAVIGYLDPSWLNMNKDWVNTLVRDASNPSTADNTFPVFRNFDWYHGHSWAHGLFEAGDGNDEESSSEDTNFAYAVKLWGRVIGDQSMEARGNLMLSVLARSLNSYFLYQRDNDVMPREYIGNKVAGIMFENKIDHTTYFGGNLVSIPVLLVPYLTLSRNMLRVSTCFLSYLIRHSFDLQNLSGKNGRLSSPMGL